MAGAIYLHLAGGDPAVWAVDLTEGDPTADVTLDIDRNTGRLAGIEILIPDGGSTFRRLRELLADPPEILGE